MNARIALLLLLLATALFGGCSSIAMNSPHLELAQTGFRAPVSRVPDVEELANDDIAFLDVPDPMESMNRFFYNFNAAFDRTIFLPVTGVYETVIPSPLRAGIHNVINNLDEFPVFVNCLLQGEFKRGFITVGRFIVNTIFGVAGLFDVASHAESLPRQQADFGQTLGVWGIGGGPYLVLPFFGPSNVRDTVGLGADTYLSYLEMDFIYDELDVDDKDDARLIELGIRSLDSRSHQPFRYYETGSPFEYELIRFIYTEKRKLDCER